MKKKFQEIKNILLLEYEVLYSVYNVLNSYSNSEISSIHLQCWQYFRRILKVKFLAKETVFLLECRTFAHLKQSAWNMSWTTEVNFLLENFFNF